ncbi:MAG: hypothetical protein GX051_05375 [Clostridiales bacterium]|nr:hypothetical protein [Clostridiales bacterium]
MGLDETDSLNPSVKELSTDDIERLMLDEKSALVFLNSCNNADRYELAWSKISGSNENIPNGYKFIGYDISYPPSCNGAFSIICDCLFICRWHGCDEAGTLFRDDFNKLNSNGLFDCFSDAYDYMIKYLNQDWTERGEYGIFEVYTKAI